jgi:F0F1-type ATP synthase membrane subunit b/b'
MNRPAPETPPTPAEAALAQVLQAEREAREAVAECRRRAETIVDAGRARARRIQARSEERIAALHVRADRTVGRTVAALAAEAQSLATPLVLDDGQRARLDRAIANLAAEVTGGAP